MKSKKETHRQSLTVLVALAVAMYLTAAVLYFVLGYWGLPSGAFAFGGFVLTMICVVGWLAISDQNDKDLE